VTIGEGTRIGPHVVIERDTTSVGTAACTAGAVLGGDPQDLKYGGEAAPLLIGDRTVIRECVTLNRGTDARGRTEIGADCLLMAYSHVAHDCLLGDHVIIANSVNMGGHCDLGDWVIVGGITAIHQFVQVGAHAFVGGSSAVRKDVPPFVKAAGDPLRLFGLNSVGLQRRGFTTRTGSAAAGVPAAVPVEENLREAVAAGRARRGPASPSTYSTAAPSSRAASGGSRSDGKAASRRRGRGQPRLPSRPHPERHAGRDFAGVYDTDAARARGRGSALCRRAARDTGRAARRVRRRGHRGADERARGVALAAIERGVHVLIEKPIAPTLAAADRIVAAAARRACWCRSDTWSASTRRCARASRTWRSRCSSSRTGSRRSARGAPTWPWCST
jgi:acyl-ACP--UDP-N-acetylglucosamine O-acyltransferase